MFKTSAFLNGSWTQGTAGETFQVRNPYNDELIADVVSCDEQDVGLAVEAAATAFHSWKTVLPKQRSAYLRRIGDLIEENKVEIAEILTKENGKPTPEALGEVGFSSSFFYWFAEECRRPHGEMIPAPVPGKKLVTVQEPLGVAALITPWNFPFAMPARKVAAALAAGCTCVVKPAEDTPLTSLALASIAEQANLPPGVLNILPCSRANVARVGTAFCQHPKVSIVSFTGSCEVGKLLYSLCGNQVKRVALELGGNAPFIVFSSCDIDSAVQGLMGAKFRNAGQTCVTANRILVEGDIYDEFLEKFKKSVATLKLGNGLDQGVTQGPIINKKQLERVKRIVEESVAAGAEVVVGGQVQGACYTPTILTGVVPGMPCWSEEIFGPVTSIRRFHTEAEAVTEANNIDRGLAAYFYSRDHSQIWRVCEQLEAGMVGVNDIAISCPEAPFGGYKTSGIGKEGAKDGLLEYTQTKLINLGGL